ncbi:MAG TPA: FAD-binding oxidoreductase, partial [Planctomycetes bacterium]|nr:FAD-binding oxidoreductase [Planctomycetota bacterium]
MKSNPQTISGWGNFPRQPCHLSSQRYEHEIRDALQANTFSHYIARGLGRAYGDSSLNEDQAVLLQTRRNRFLSFDEKTGILSCEAGASFEEIL